MASKCRFAKDKKQRKLVEQYAGKRKDLKAIIKNTASSPEDIEEAFVKLRKLPRDSSATRLRNRCALTGRSRGYIGKFGLCRIAFRELALNGEVPGVTKSSW